MQLAEETASFAPSLFSSGSVKEFGGPAVSCYSNTNTNTNTAAPIFFFCHMKICCLLCEECASSLLSNNKVSISVLALF